MMKKLIIPVLLFLFTSLALNAEKSAEEEYLDAVETAQHVYRQKLVNQLYKADRIVIYLMDFDGESDKTDGFFTKKNILQKKSLTQKEVSYC